MVARDLREVPHAARPRVRPARCRGGDRPCVGRLALLRPARRRRARRAGRGGVDAAGLRLDRRARGQLPGANLAARELRTVVVSRRRAPSRRFDDPTLGDVDASAQIESRAVLATPIVVFDEMIGVFALHAPMTRPTGPRPTVAVAEAVAREVGLAVRIARLLSENEERLRQQKGLLRRGAAGHRGARARDGAAAARRTSSRRWSAPTPPTSISSTRAGGMLRCAAVHGLPGGARRLRVHRRTAGVAAEAMRTGRPRRLGDYSAAPTAFAAPGLRRLHECDRRADRLGRRDARRARRRTRATTRALRRARHRRHRRVRIARRARAAERGDVRGAHAAGARPARLLRIATVLGQPLSLAETLDAVAQAAAEALGGDFAAVLMPRRDGGLELAGAFELPRRSRAALARGCRASAGVLALCAGERRVIAALVARRRRPLRQRVDGSSLERRAAAPCSPYRSRHRAVERSGVVLVCFAERARFTDDDLELARQLAHAARGALERSELFEAERSARALAQQLARTGSLLATELDPEAVLEEVVAAGAAPARRRRVRDPRASKATSSSSPRRAARAPTRCSARDCRRAAGRRRRVPVAEAPLRSPNARGGSSATPTSTRSSPPGYSAYLGVPLVGPEGTVARRARRSTRRARERGARTRSRRCWRSRRTPSRGAVERRALHVGRARSRAQLRDPREHRRRHRRRRPRRRTSSSGTLPPSGSRASRRADALGRTVEDVLQRASRHGGAAPGRLVSIAARHRGGVALA